MDVTEKRAIISKVRMQENSRTRAPGRPGSELAGHAILKRPRLREVRGWGEGGAAAVPHRGAPPLKRGKCFHPLRTVYRPRWHDPDAPGGSGSGASGRSGARREAE